MEDDFFALRRERALGTADWIVDDPQFLYWNNTHEPRSRVLLIHGTPGSGKSVLAARMVYHVSNNTNLCIYSFCRYKDRQDLKAILRTAIFQVAEQHEEYGNQLQRLRGMHEFNADDLESLKYLWQNVLIRQLERISFSRPIKWIIDGLDEMNAEQRIVFLKYLADLEYTKLDLKILVLSRYTGDIELKLKDIGSGFIELNEERIFADIRAFIHHKVQNSESLSMPHIGDKLISHLETHCHGLFLWVRLILDELSQMTTDAEINTCLISLPTSLVETYNRTLRRLEENLKPSQQRLSKGIFQWTVYACRPLTLEELSTALQPEFRGLVSLKQEIKRSCGGLIVVDGQGNVKLLHSTVSEYAKQSRFIYQSDMSQTAISKRCLESILAFDFSRALDEDLEEQYPLLSYSCEYWTSHVQSCPPDEALSKAVSSLLTTSSALTWIKVMFLIGRHSILPQSMERVLQWARTCEPTEQSHNLETLVLRWIPELRVLTQVVTPTVEQYTGDDRDGRRHGPGVCVYEIGDVYEGCWEEGRRSGFGQIRFKNGNLYEGMWKNDRQHGEGFWKFSDGVSYHGSWNNGEAEEGGMWKFRDGTTRMHLSCGQDGLPNLTYVNYKGTCTTRYHDAVGRFGEDSDPPIWIYPNGSRYVGGWRNGYEDGYGSWYCICGCEYKGYLENGKENGEGVWRFRTGNVYTGDWRDGREHGFGVLQFHMGHEYRGKWKNGKADGEGLMKFANGNSYKGVWQDGRLLGKTIIEFGEQWMERMTSTTIS